MAISTSGSRNMLNLDYVLPGEKPYTLSYLRT